MGRREKSPLIENDWTREVSREKQLEIWEAMSESNTNTHYQSLVNQDSVGHCPEQAMTTEIVVLKAFL